MKFKLFLLTMLLLVLSCGYFTNPFVPIEVNNTNLISIETPKPLSNTKYYIITNVSTGNFLTAEASFITNKSNLNSTTQNWTFFNYQTDYIVANRSNSKLVDIDHNNLMGEGSSSIPYDYAYSYPLQFWALTYVGTVSNNDLYVLTNKVSGLVLTANGNNVIQSAYVKDNNNQIWSFTELP